MHYALTELQDLLSRLRDGGTSVVDAGKFADSLGLETDYMQDPNEFGRLLFDRMHESLMICFGGGTKMGDLLPNLFRGRMRYQTKCLCCGMVSQREEDFMDVTLNIDDGSGGGGGGMDDVKKKNGVKNGSAGNTVAYFLERYFAEEKLIDDNKYFCTKCDEKREAIRTVGFLSLPHVLNLQLARYVFYSQYGMKKKIMEEVYLPKYLKVPVVTGGDEDTTECVTFVLCGVLHHLGNSAYEGHYTASAMDWRSGLWYEFNDEDVTYLEKGLDCVYEEEEDKGKKGSVHAYNMFYVESGYLSKFVEDVGMLRNEEDTSTDDDEEKDEMKKVTINMVESALVKVKKERETYFESVREILKRDEETKKTLTLRRASITSQLVPAIITPPTTPFTRTFWVDGLPLRRFLSCTSLSLPPDDSVACVHSTGLHPRVARRGKLLNETALRVYVGLLKREHPEGMREEEIMRWIAPDHVECETCRVEYQCDLKKKYEVFKTMIELMYELSPKNSTISEDDDDDLHLLSRKFITELRAYVTKKLKEAIHSPLVKREGLDRLDLAALGAAAPPLPILHNSKQQKNNTSLDLFDPTVNSIITCDHGNYVYNKRSTRLIPSPTWLKIKTLFPCAVTLKKSDGDCPQCEKEYSRQSLLPETLHSWAKKNLEDVILDRIYDGVDYDDYTLQDGVLYLVHSNITYRWRRAITEHMKKKKMASGTLFSFVEKLGEEVVDCGSGGKKEPLDLYCSHGMVMPISAPLEKLMVDLLYPTKKMTEESDGTKEKEEEDGFEDEVEILTKEELNALRTSLLDLKKLFSPDFEVSNDIDFVPHVTFTREEQYLTRTEEDKTPPPLPQPTPHFCTDPSCQPLSPPSSPSHSTTTSCKNATPSSHVITIYEIVDKSHTPQTLSRSTLSLPPPSSNSFDDNVAMTSNNNNLRRSTRKRKLRAPDNVKMHTLSTLGDDTLAKFRLLLLEQLGKSPLHQELTLAASPKTTPTAVADGDAEMTTQNEPILLKLPMAWNHMTMQEIISDHCGPDYKWSEIMAVFLRYLDHDDSANELTFLTNGVSSTAENENGRSSPLPEKRMTPAKKKEEKKLLETSMIDALMETATGGSQQKNDRSFLDMMDEMNRKRQKTDKEERRGAERGFRGTLLQSGMNGNNNTTTVAMEIENENEEGGVLAATDLIKSCSNLRTNCEGNQNGMNDGNDALHPIVLDDDEQVVDVANNAAAITVDDDSIIIVETETSGDIPLTNGNSTKTPPSPISKAKNPETPPAAAAAAAPPHHIITTPSFKNSTPPMNKMDLSKVALSYTRPLYHTIPPSYPRIPPLANRCMRLEVLDHEQVMIFISNATDLLDKKPDGLTMSEIRPIAPEILPDSHTRHLFRNFIDSVDKILPTERQKQTTGRPLSTILVSRRELDIMLYFMDKNDDGAYCSAVHEVMPYRNERNLQKVYSALKKYGYHEKEEYKVYMENVRRCVGLILELEGKGEDSDEDEEEGGEVNVAMEDGEEEVEECVDTDANEMPPLEEIHDAADDKPTEETPLSPATTSPHTICQKLITRLINTVTNHDTNSNHDSSDDDTPNPSECATMLNAARLFYKLPPNILSIPTHPTHDCILQKAARLINANRTRHLQFRDQIIEKFVTWLKRIDKGRAGTEVTKERERAVKAIRAGRRDMGDVSFKSLVEDVHLRNELFDSAALVFFSGGEKDTDEDEEEEEEEEEETEDDKQQQDDNDLDDDDDDDDDTLPPPPLIGRYDKETIAKLIDLIAQIEGKEPSSRQCEEALDWARRAAGLSLEDVLANSNEDCDEKDQTTNNIIYDKAVAKLLVDIEKEGGGEEEVGLGI